MPRLPEISEMITKLVALPSVSSVDARFDQGNAGVIEQVAEWADALSMRLTRMPMPGAKDKLNLIATLGEGEGGLVLSGHADTVPFDEAGWQQDPFKATLTSDRIVGLGTADMKSFFAVALQALSDIDVKKLKAPVIIVATADEESSMAGARALVKAGVPRARHAVIGEPTSLIPVRMHKGAIMEAVKLIGQSGHSSDPSLGRNALEGMHRVIAVLLSYRDELVRLHRNENFVVPTPTMNLGAIHGGDSPNRICAECELRFDLRPLPGMDVQAHRKEIRARVTQAVDGLGLKVEWKAEHGGTPAFETPESAEIVRAAAELTGAEPTSAMFGTEAPYMTELGMQTIVLGPGDIAQAHQPNEYIRLDALAPAVRVIRSLVHRFCAP
ncbi:MAG: acetylornithine deacetylase [Sandaracinaceae bacterium]|nr:acetylornithine deacetylase [Sandaracinaceae bacterium]